ncbi:MAG: hypothetical protein R2932_43140 [Caldilineaceae bacterium]
MMWITLNDLEAFRIAIGSPGERNRYPYRISVARISLAFRMKASSPTGQLSGRT